MAGSDWVPVPLSSSVAVAPLVEPVAPGVVVALLPDDESDEVPDAPLEPELLASGVMVPLVPEPVALLPAASELPLEPVAAPEVPVASVPVVAPDEPDVPEPIVAPELPEDELSVVPEVLPVPEDVSPAAGVAPVADEPLVSVELDDDEPDEPLAGASDAPAAPAEPLSPLVAAAAPLAGAASDLALSADFFLLLCFFFVAFVSDDAVPLVPLDASCW